MQLLILPPGEGIKTINMNKTETNEADICRLMDISLDVRHTLPFGAILMIVQLLSRPVVPSPAVRKAVSTVDDEAERKLRTELSQREASDSPTRTGYRS